MEPIQPNFKEKYATLVRSIEIVHPHQNFVRSIWRTPSGRDLYEKFNFSRPPFDPLTSVGDDAGSSS